MKQKSVESNLENEYNLIENIYKSKTFKINAQKYAKKNVRK